MQLVKARVKAVLTIGVCVELDLLFVNFVDVDMGFDALETFLFSGVVLIFSVGNSVVVLGLVLASSGAVLFS